MNSNTRLFLERSSRYDDCSPLQNQGLTANIYHYIASKMKIVDSINSILKPDVVAHHETPYLDLHVSV